MKRSLVSTRDPKWIASLDRWLERMGPVKNPTRRDLAAVAALFTFVATLLYGVAWLRQPDFAVDLAIYREAAIRAWSGSSAYEAGYAPLDRAGTLPFAYPPTALLLFVALIPPLPLVIAALWMVSCGALVLTVRMITIPHRSWSRFSPRDTRVVFIATLVLATFPWIQTLFLGQVNALLAFLVVADAIGLRRSRWGGILIGIATCVKLTPGVFIIWLWFSGRKRAAINAASTIVAIVLLTAVVLPESLADYITGGAQLAITSNAPLSSPANQSLFGLLERYGEPSRVGTAIVSATALALALAGTVLAVRLASRNLPLAVTMLGLVSVSVAPIGWTHHFVWLPLVAIALWNRPQQPWDRVVAVALFAVAFVPPFALVDVDAIGVLRPLSALYFWITIALVAWLLARSFRAQRQTPATAR